MFDSYHEANGVRFPACQCCGDYGWQAMRGMELVAGTHKEPDAVYRCEKHVGRNPCAIDGCARTHAAGKAAPYHYADDDYLCGRHFKIVCPPHSPIRRTYNRFFKLAKRDGWNMKLRIRYWRFWRGLVRHARADRGPPMDIDEINRMFGWDQ